MGEEYRATGRRSGEKEKKGTSVINPLLPYGDSDCDCALRAGWASLPNPCQRKSEVEFLVHLTTQNMWKSKPYAILSSRKLKAPAQSDHHSFAYPSLARYYYCHYFTCCSCCRNFLMPSMNGTFSSTQKSEHTISVVNRVGTMVFHPTRVLP